MIKSLFNIKMDEEYSPMVDDLIKMFIILFVVNILMFVTNPKDNRLFSESYVKLMIFILLGISTYWLVVKKIVVFN